VPDASGIVGARADIERGGVLGVQLWSGRLAGSGRLHSHVGLWAAVLRRYFARSLWEVRQAHRNLTRRALRLTDHRRVGQSLNGVPEPALPLLLGVAGSAFCASVARAWEEAKDTLSPDLARIISAVLSEVRVTVPAATSRQKREL